MTPVKAICAAYLAECAIPSSNGSAKKALRPPLAAFGHLDPKRITMAAIREYIERQMAASTGPPVPPGSTHWNAVREIAVLQTAFIWYANKCLDEKKGAILTARRAAAGSRGRKGWRRCQ